MEVTVTEVVTEVVMTEVEAKPSVGVFDPTGVTATKTRSVMTVDIGKSLTSSKPQPQRARWISIVSSRPHHIRATPAYLTQDSSSAMTLDSNLLSASRFQTHNTRFTAVTTGESCRTSTTGGDSEVYTAKKTLEKADPRQCRVEDAPPHLPMGTLG